MGPTCQVHLVLFQGSRPYSSGSQPAGPTSAKGVVRMHKREREREGIARKWRVFKTASIYVAITTHSCSLLRVKKQLDVHGVVLVYTHIFPEVYIISSLAKTIRPFPLFLQVGNVHGKLCCFSFHWELELKDSPSCGNAHIVVLINLF